MIITDVEIKSMVETVFLHLSYLSAVSKTKMLEESSVRYPLVEFIERRLQINKVVLEYPHTIFKKRRCDLFIDDSKNKIIIEFKYVREKTNYEFQEYFDDLLRLYHMSRNGYKTFFLVCGNTFDFNNGFKCPKLKSAILSGRRRKPSGRFAKCLSFNYSNPQKIVDTRKFKNDYSDFCTDYIFRKKTATHPSSIVLQTRLVHIENGTDLQSIAIWEIS